MSRFVSQQVNEELIEAIKRNKGDIRKFLEELKEMLNKQKDYDMSLMQGLSAIIKHEKAGGKVLTTAMPYDASSNEIFAEALKKSGVAFISMSVNNPSKELFLTRDTDARIVEHIKHQVLGHLTRKTGELSPDSLEKKYEGEAIYVKRDMDNAELEIFRRHVSDKADYALSTELENDNKYILMYPESHARTVEKAIDKAIFELSGKDGERLRDSLNDAIERKDAFIKAIEERNKSGDTAYIVDSLNPSRFLTVNELSEIILHETKLVERENGKRELIDDKIKAERYANLTDYIDVLKSPILLTQKEFDFLHTKPATFFEDVENMRMKLLIYPKERRYTAGEDIEKLLNPIYQKMSIYREIPRDVLEKLKEYARSHNLSKTVITDTEIACAEADKAEIDRFLEENLYATYVPEDKPYLKTFTDYEARFYHEGRGKLNLSDLENMDTQYIVDTQNLNYVIALSEFGLTIYTGFPNKGNIFIAEDNEFEHDEDGNVIRDTKFDADVLRLLASCKDPVVFTKEEMEGLKDEDEFLTAVGEKRPDLFRCRAADELITKIYTGTSHEFDAIFTGNGGHLTDRQAQAIEKIREYKENRQTVADVNKEYNGILNKTNDYSMEMEGISRS